jgi:hypothetical protein
MAMAGTVSATKEVETATAMTVDRKSAQRL